MILVGKLFKYENSSNVTDRSLIYSVPNYQ